MKKLGLITLLSVLTVGALVGCGGNNSSSENPSSSEPTSSEVSSEVKSEEVSSEEVSSESSSEEVETNELPAAWAEGDTSWAAANCSVHLMPAEGSSVKSVKEFLNYPGARFIDLRDETEGYSAGHVERFESISYFRLVEKLFSRDGKVFTPLYDDSEFYLNAMFPKDAPIFLMCAAGGRVVHMINLLNQYKYDTSKIYNVGGWDSIQAADQAGTNPYAVSIGFSAAKTNEYNITLEAPAAVKSVRRAAATVELPDAWAEGDTSWAAANSSVHLMPAEGSNQKSVKEFLNYPGARFIDLRDSTEGYSAGHVERFESISYFRLIEKLFSRDGKVFTPLYDDSEYYLNAMFPKDTPIFLMCAAGGRVVHMINLLNQYKYDMSQVYNVGGWDSIQAADQAGTNPYGISIGFSAAKTNEYNITL